MERSATPLVAEITDRLVTAIAAGEFLPGSRLPPERDLAVLLGVGRTSVRAALAGLHDRGLIDTSRGRSGGSFVRLQWSAGTESSVLNVLGEHWTAISDRLETTRRLGGALARAAAERRDDADVETIEQRLTDYRDAGDPRGQQLADAALHGAIAEAAKIDTLQTLLFDLEAELMTGTHLHVWGEEEARAADPDDRRALREHEALVSAIRDGRAADAEAVALEHGRLDLERLEATRRRAERLVLA